MPPVTQLTQVIRVTQVTVKFEMVWCQMSAVPLDPSVCRVEGRAMEPSAKKARSEFFPSISKIQFEGPQSINPLAFKYYQPDEVIMGKKMRCMPHCTRRACRTVQRPKTLSTLVWKQLHCLRTIKIPLLPHEPFWYLFTGYLFSSSQSSK